MSASNAFETDLLELIFNGTTIANLADNAASSPVSSLYVSLHTADPGEAGNQTTSEAAYTGYTRIAVDRDNTGFTVSGNSVSNAAAITFPACSGGSETLTHFAIGTASSGTGYLIVSGELDASLAVSNGITPFFDTGDLQVDVD